MSLRPVAFRDLDGDGEAAPVIRRYLDRAAFKAAQEGRVTVVGRTRPETVAALLEWTVEGRAATVALAPCRPFCRRTERDQEIARLRRKPVVSPLRLPGATGSGLRAARNNLARDEVQGRSSPSSRRKYSGEV